MTPTSTFPELPASPAPAGNEPAYHAERRQVVLLAAAVVAWPVGCSRTSRRPPTWKCRRIDTSLTASC